MLLVGGVGGHRDRRLAAAAAPGGGSARCAAPRCRRPPWRPAGRSGRGWRRRAPGRGRRRAPPPAGTRDPWRAECVRAARPCGAGPRVAPHVALPQARPEARRHHDQPAATRVVRRRIWSIAASWLFILTFLVGPVLLGNWLFVIPAVGFVVAAVATMRLARNPEGPDAEVLAPGALKAATAKDPVVVHGTWSAGGAVRAGAASKGVLRFADKRISFTTDDGRDHLRRPGQQGPHGRGARLLASPARPRHRWGHPHDPLLPAVGPRRDRRRAGRGRRVVRPAARPRGRAEVAARRPTARARR